jgi:hypothetical protein
MENRVANDYWELYDLMEKGIGKLEPHTSRRG